MCRSQKPPITVMCCSQNTPTMLPLGCEGTGWGWCINIIILHIPKKTHGVGKKKKKKVCVCVTTRLVRRQLTVMLFITPIASFCLCKDQVQFCTLKVIQLALQHLIRSLCHREADESVCKLLQEKP